MDINNQNVGHTINDKFGYGKKINCHINIQAMVWLSCLTALHFWKIH